MRSVDTDATLDAPVGAAADRDAQAAPEPDVTLEPAGAAFGARRPRRRRAAPLTGCVNVLPDNSGRLGTLSYTVPATMEVRPGDAVRVPFGKRYVHGMVVGAGDPDKATRPVDAVFGVRCDPSDVSLARSIAKHHFSTEAAVLPRLAPKTGRGAEPQPDEPLELAPTVVRIPLPQAALTSRRALLVRAPLVDPAHLAASQVQTLLDGHPEGQVLVLCPTVALVEAVLAQFTSGAARLDSKAPRGAWKGFCEGTVRVGVGTRSAALYAAAHLAGIVVVEENHPGHLEATQPHTHARDVAIARSRALRVPLRLICAVPSPQALGADVVVVAVGARTDWPKMRLVDRGDVDPVARLLPPSVQSALNSASKAGRRPVVLAQRRSAVRKCVRCSLPRPCQECESSLCRHADPSPCPRCTSTDGVRMRGWDKERLKDLLGKRAKVVSLAELGKVRDAGLVILFDLDAAAAAAELVPGTLLAGVITQAAEAAGHGGQVIGLADECANGTNPVIDALFGPRDMLVVARSFYTAAKQANLPPFGRVVTVRVKRKSKPSVAGWPGQVHGPRQSGQEWEILVRIPSADLLELAPVVERLRRAGNARVTVS